MIRRALIGHTGFVGSSLSIFGEYTDFYNSTNFTEMVGQAYDEIVCSGVSAAKWLANKEPKQDWCNIQSLLDVLTQTNIKRFVLISTIDVYPDPSQALTEDAVLDGAQNHAYGRHRLQIEEWAKDRFSKYLIVRLPALFGPNLKKNVLYDLLNDNNVDKINPAGVFQWYPITRLHNDIVRASTEGLKLVNLFTAPILMRNIIDELFPGAPVGQDTRPAPAYNLRTKHASIFGGRDGFIMDSDEVLAALRAYVNAESQKNVVLRQ